MLIHRSQGHLACCCGTTSSWCDLPEFILASFSWISSRYLFKLFTRISTKKYRTLYLLFCFIWENCAIACRAEHTSSVISWQTKPTPTSGQLLTCIGLHAQFYSKKLVEVRWLIQNLGHDWSLGGWTDSTTEAALSCHGDTPDTWYPAVALPVVSQKLPQISGSWTLTINGSFSDTFGQYVIS